MKDNSYLDKLENLIDQLFYEGTINQGTLQILSDMFCSLYEVDNKEEFLSQLKDTYQMKDTSLESLNQYLDRELKGWQQDNEDYEEIFKERFNIGESMKYPKVKEFLKDLDYEIMQGVLNGSITSGFKQAIPEELFEFLPLDSFEENVLKNIKEFWNDDPKECDELISTPKELQSFDENIVDILIYIYETFSADYIAEIADGRTGTLKETKERFCLVYDDRFKFLAYLENKKLLEKTQHQLSTELWVEGKIAAEWWANKAQEKLNDKNFYIFSENMVKFHLKEIRGSYILDCFRDISLEDFYAEYEEKARIIKEAKETCQWFIK